MKIVRPANIKDLASCIELLGLLFSQEREVKPRSLCSEERAGKTMNITADCSFKRKYLYSLEPCLNFLINYSIKKEETVI